MTRLPPAIVPRGMLASSRSENEATGDRSWVPHGLTLLLAIRQSTRRRLGLEGFCGAIRLLAGAPADLPGGARFPEHSGTQLVDIRRVYLIQENGLYPHSRACRFAAPGRGSGPAAGPRQALRRRT